jgi:hypothetical protein
LLRRGSTCEAALATKATDVKWHQVSLDFLGGKFYRTCWAADLIEFAWQPNLLNLLKLLATMTVDVLWPQT